nr:hypothetical protein [Roseomonas sp. SXEYE001]
MAGSDRREAAQGQDVHVGVVAADRLKEECEAFAEGIRDIFTEAGSAGS